MPNIAVLPSCRLAVNETNHSHFMAWFANAKNKKIDFSSPITTVRGGPLWTACSLLKWNKGTEEEKIIVDLRFFNKLNNDMWKLHTGARATKQKHISIYIFLCTKPFLMKMGYIYTPIFIWTMITTMFQEKSNMYHISEPIIGRFFPKLVPLCSLSTSFLLIHLALQWNAATLCKVLAPFSFSHVIDSCSLYNLFSHFSRSFLIFF